MTQSTKPYVLLRGRHFSQNKDGENVVYEKGDIVELTPDQAHNFRDKFRDANAVKIDQEAMKAKAAINAEAKAKLDEAKAKTQAEAKAAMKAKVTTSPTQSEAK